MIGRPRARGDDASWVMGVHFGHNASVALSRNGRIVFALEEEKVRRIKNFTGFPTQAYDAAVAEFLDHDVNRLSLAVFPSVGNQEFDFFFRQGRFDDGRYFPRYADSSQRADLPGPDLQDEASLRRYIEDDRARVAGINDDEAIAQEAVAMFEKELRVPRDRFVFHGHHDAHAYSAVFNLDPSEDWLIFTLDGSGDNLCATVRSLSGGTLTTLSTNERYVSLGRFYREVTAFLGMKPDEHEAKVMGLAAYAKEVMVAPVLSKMLPLAWVDDQGLFQSAFPMELARSFLLQHGIYERFDVIAGAAQELLERRVVEWIAGWMERRGATRVALAGGVFLNVKLNQRIAEIPAVKDLFVVPSAGDESIALGSAYYGSLLLGAADDARPLQDLGLGPAYDDRTITDALESIRGLGVRVRECADVEREIASLVASGEIVGRFAERAEFGARALGHRSLLADPRRRDNVELINQIIKGRDFWMPFAPSLLAEDADRYVVNPKGLDAPYMILTFRCTPLGREHLSAAVHHGDFTTRPQIVRREWNPSYFRLLSLFKDLTGVGGVLNTSLNLHGEALAMAPVDALKVFTESGLRHLALERWLLSKEPLDTDE